MLGFIKRFLGDNNDKEIARYRKVVEKINALEPQMQALTDDKLTGYTNKFRERLANGETLDDILPEAFAVVREGSRRVLGMRHFDVQLIGGMCLHEGKIAEMRTGEGKTLVATLPVYLNALTGEGVHMVTVNDYLARRDSEDMGRLYRYLGLTVGLVVHDMDFPERKFAYSRDVTFGTNNEFGFDYLRDNMVIYPEQMVQRKLHYAIVDEVDSILIDEARTPLIISGPVAVSTHQFEQLKPAIADLANRQSLLCSRLIQEAKTILAKENPSDEEMDTAITKLLQVKLGMPQHKQLMHILESSDVLKRLEKMEMFVKSDQNRGMLQEVQEELFFAMDEKQHEADLTEKGRVAISPSDPNAFVLPDLLEEIHAIDTDPNLTEAQKMEKKQAFQQEFSEKSERLQNLSQLLRAYCLFEKDVHYVVQDNKVLIVDEHTGRILPGRRFSEGLHQALEAKENVTIEKETQTLASITIQNYFRLYGKLSGMTGTAMTEEEEFAAIYNLDIIEIPTNKPVIRIDNPDVVYKNEAGKLRAIIEQIRVCHEKGQPVLVGTVSIEKSEQLSKLLRKAGIPHNVLNAKHHEKEAEIVAQAGKFGAVTIATNMAGRGTDIMLGGNAEYLAKADLRKAGFTEEVIAEATGYAETEDEEILKARTLFAERMAEHKKSIDAEADRVREAGGLYIIGTERHESRRIDNQLRGRSGRQGDPGESRFYLSLQDDLMRLFSTDRVMSMMDSLGLDEDTPIDAKILSNAVENAQKSVESRNFRARKNVLEYDNVMNTQREVIYAQRQKVLDGEDLRENMMQMLRSLVESDVSTALSGHGGEVNEDGLKGLANAMEGIYFAKGTLASRREQLLAMNADELTDTVFEIAKHTYEAKEAAYTPKIMRELERVVMLRVVDEYWMDNIDAMDDLKQGIGLRAYGQHDPVIAYKEEGYQMFEAMITAIKEETIRRMFLVQLRPAQEVKREKVAKETGTSAPDKSQVKRAPVRKEHKVGPNDPCPCGSGKKYKKCCMQKDKLES